MNNSYFKAEKANAAFNLWASIAPESYHPYDMDRWAEMVVAVLDAEEELERDYIENALSNKLTEGMIDGYMDNYNSMKRVYNLLRNRWGV